MKKYILFGAGAVLLIGAGLFLVNINKTQAAGGNLLGWAWSSNIGWISVNSSNSGGADCGTYCVNVNSSGTMTGYAWSSNIGWIKFGALSGMPNGGANAALTLTGANAGTVIGFARACAGTVKASGNIAYVQSRSQDTSATSANLAFTSANTAGNMIVVGLRIGSPPGRTVSVTDSQGNAYTQAVNKPSGADHEDFIFYAPNIKAGANTVTASISGALATIRWAIHEYSGADTSNPLDQTSSNASSGITADPGAKTTTSANELIFSFGSVNNSSTFTPAASYTQRETQVSKFASEDWVVSSTGSYDATFTLGTSGPWAAVMATFKAAAASAPGDCSTMTSRTDGWDGWIELSGANHISPNQSGTGGVTMNTSNGIFSGYAWGADVVGWMTFNAGIGTPVTCPGCVNIVPALSGTCTLNGTAGNTVTLPAAPTGGTVVLNVTGLNGTGPYTYAWVTGLGGSPTNSPPYTTPAYTTAGSYQPNVVVTDSSNGAQTPTLACGTVVVPANTSGPLNLYIGPNVANANKATFQITQGNTFTLKWTIGVPASYTCRTTIDNSGNNYWGSSGSQTPHWDNSVLTSRNDQVLTTAGISVPAGTIVSYNFKINCDQDNPPPTPPTTPGHQDKTVTLQLKSSSLEER